MKKFLAVLVCAVFIFALFPMPKENRSAAQAQTEIGDADFDESSVMALIRQNTGGIRLFSSEPTLEELGIAEAKNLDEPMQSEVSLFSVRSEAAVYKLTLAEPGRENVLEMIEKLNELSYVELAEPNYICTLYSTPNDTYYTKGNQYGLGKINAPAVWDMDIDCSGVTVAVFDTGTMINHPDLKANIWTNPGEIPDNGIDDDENGLIDDVNGWNFADDNNNPTDDNGHGTHVSGIVSAVTNNGRGVASLSRNAKILPIKIFNAQGLTTVDIRYQAIKYIEKMKIPIVNCSYGSLNKADLLEEAVKECKNTVFITAAGNAKENETPKNIDITQTYPASYDSDNVISVASTDKDDNLSTFSYYGAVNVDIAAPGSAIASTYSNNGTAAYGNLSGTSMASPMVASAAAVIKAKYPDITPQEIRTVIEEGADKLDTLTGKVKTGARLNAYGALEKAALIMPTPSPTPTPTPTPSSTPTLTPTPSQTLTPTPTSTLTPSPTLTPTSTPTLIPTLTPPPTPSPTDFGIRYEDGNAVVTAPREGTYCVIFALYKDKALVGIETADAEFAEAGEMSVPMSTSVDGADCVKAMLWEKGSMRPLCKSDERRFFE